jgi:hypothetical protein
MTQEHLLYEGEFYFGSWSWSKAECLQLMMAFVLAESRCGLGVTAQVT